MRVRDVMITKVTTVEETTSAREAYQVMKDGSFRHLPVVKEEKLSGIVSDRDMRLVMSVSGSEADEVSAEFIPEDLKVKDVMTEHPAILVPDADLRQAVALMARHKIGALPVMERGSLVGILSVTDLLKLLAELLGGTP